MFTKRTREVGKQVLIKKMKTWKMKTEDPKNEDQKQRPI